MVDGSWNFLKRGRRAKRPDIPGKLLIITKSRACVSINTGPFADRRPSKHQNWASNERIDMRIGHVFPARRARRSLRWGPYPIPIMCVNQIGSGSWLICNTSIACQTGPGITRIASQPLHRDSWYSTGAVVLWLGSCRSWLQPVSSCAEACTTKLRNNVILRRRRGSLPQNPIWMCKTTRKRRQL